MIGPRPPRLARAILLALAPAEWRDQIDGDLAENFALRWERDGRWSATSWYWRQLWTVDVWRLRRSSRRGRPAGAWLAGLGYDVRGGFRAVRRQPLYAVMVVATLAERHGSSPCSPCGQSDATSRGHLSGDDGGAAGTLPGCRPVGRARSANLG